MAYTATALARTADGWTGQEVDLADSEDLDAAADAAREAGDGGLVLLLVEEDDEYVGILRVDGDDDDPRVFLSDRRVLDSYDLAERLFADALPVPVPDEEEDEDTPRPLAEPAGDLELLADLGTPGDALVELCAEEGMLPADVIYALCERAGCLEALEEVRGT